MGEIENADTIIIVVKIFSMIVMFLMIAIVGSIPIRAKAFRSNQVAISKNSRKCSHSQPPFRVGSSSRSDCCIYFLKLKNK